jgi:hypothetical protein
LALLDWLDYFQPMAFLNWGNNSRSSVNLTVPAVTLSGKLTSSGSIRSTVAIPGFNLSLLVTKV